MTEDPNPVPSEAEGPPVFRTFGLNSQEFYDIACPRQDQPWILNGSLPRTPRSPEPKVIVEGKDHPRPDRGSRITSLSAPSP